jgi:hypothetical protein
MSHDCLPLPIIDGARPGMDRLAEALATAQITTGERMFLTMLALDSYDGQTAAPPRCCLIRWVGMTRNRGGFYKMRDRLAEAGWFTYEVGGGRNTPTVYTLTFQTGRQMPTRFGRQNRSADADPFQEPNRSVKPIGETGRQNRSADADPPSPRTSLRRSTPPSSTQSPEAHEPEPLAEARGEEEENHLQRDREVVAALERHGFGDWEEFSTFVSWDNNRRVKQGAEDKKIRHPEAWLVGARDISTRVSEWRQESDREAQAARKPILDRFDLLMEVSDVEVRATRAELAAGRISEVEGYDRCPFTKQRLEWAALHHSWVRLDSWQVAVDWLAARGENFQIANIDQVIVLGPSVPVAPTEIASVEADVKVEEQQEESQ